MFESAESNANRSTLTCSDMFHRGKRKVMLEITSKPAVERQLLGVAYFALDVKSRLAIHCLNMSVNGEAARNFLIECAASI